MRSLLNLDLTHLFVPNRRKFNPYIREYHQPAIYTQNLRPLSVHLYIMGNTFLGGLFRVRLGPISCTHYGTRNGPGSNGSGADDLLLDLEWPRRWHCGLLAKA